MKKSLLHRGILIDRIPADGAGGLIFAAGTTFIFLIDGSQARSPSKIVPCETTRVTPTSPIISSIVIIGTSGASQKLTSL